jgi:hypothetical protein
MDKVNLQVIRELFGRVVYSHKTQEKEAEMQQKNARDIKILNILLVSLTAGPLLANMITNQKVLLIAGSIFSFLALVFTIFQLSFDPEKRASDHKNTANKLWLIRERFVCLIADISSGHIPEDIVIIKRDALIDDLDVIYKTAPNTSSKAYGKARAALRSCEELTFSNDEINHFLPKSLWL